MFRHGAPVSVLNTQPCRPGPRAGAQGRPARSSPAAPDPDVRFAPRIGVRGRHPGRQEIGGWSVMKCHDPSRGSCLRTERTTVSPRPPSRGPGPPGPVFARGTGSGCPLRFIRRDKGGGVGMSCYVMKCHDSARRPSIRSALPPHFCRISLRQTGLSTMFFCIPMGLNGAIHRRPARRGAGFIIGIKNRITRKKSKLDSSSSGRTSGTPYGSAAVVLRAASRSTGGRRRAGAGPACARRRRRC